jgi:hypothetical protein
VLGTRESDAILLCGEEENRSSVTENRTDHYVLVGFVPCKVSSKMHIDGRHAIMQAQGESDGHTGTHLVERSPKQARIVSAEGCEIVGPGYSDPAIIGSGRAMHNNGVGVSNIETVVSHARKTGDGVENSGGNTAQKQEDVGDLSVYGKMIKTDSAPRSNPRQVPAPR